MPFLPCDMSHAWGLPLSYEISACVLWSKKVVLKNIYCISIYFFETTEKSVLKKNC